MSDICIISSNQIDKSKWNHCVDANENGLIYSHSEYLDAMCNEWHGLIIDDYKTIFALPLRHKWGLVYSYMPAFTQQLGFVGNLDIDYEKAIAKIFSFVKYGSPYINFSNTAFSLKNGCGLMNNLILPLNNSYEQIKQSYKKGIEYSFSKAARTAMSYIPSTDIEEAITLYRKSNEHKMSHVVQKDYESFEKLCVYLQNNNQLFIRKMIDENNSLLCIALLLKDDKRYYNMLNHVTDDGRKCEANYLLYDSVFKEFANQNRLFDFEGSDIPGVRSFYEKFGALEQPYFHWHFNQLPWPLRILKK
jgi:hypothetical protein